MSRYMRGAFAHFYSHSSLTHNYHPIFHLAISYGCVFDVDDDIFTYIQHIEDIPDIDIFDDNDIHIHIGYSYINIRIFYCYIL